METKTLITPQNCRKLASALGFKIFDDRLNIWGIRTPKGEFNDYFILFPAIDEGYLLVEGTTEPSTGYISTIFNSGGRNINGIATLVSNQQYLNCWMLGYHKGRYEALVQVGHKFLVTRHKKDTEDFYITTNVYTDVGGLNFHTTKIGYTLNAIKGFSEGCQVVFNAKEYFNKVIPLIKRYNQRVYDYTIVDIDKFNLI